MSFQDKLRAQANKLASKTPEEIAQEIEREEQEELARLERLLSLAKAAGEYLESTDQPTHNQRRRP